MTCYQRSAAATTPARHSGNRRSAGCADGPCRRARQRRCPQAAANRIRAAARKRLCRSSAAAGSFSELRRRGKAHGASWPAAARRHARSWSRELFVVTYVSEPSADALALPSYRVETSAGEPLLRRFYVHRDDLQKIEADTLMTHEARRPAYSRGSLFNQEAHLSALPARRGGIARTAPLRAPQGLAGSAATLHAPHRHLSDPCAHCVDQAASAPFGDASPPRARPRIRSSSSRATRLRGLCSRGSAAARRPIFLVR
jgi:hypothetical protein